MRAKRNRGWVILFAALLIPAQASRAADVGKGKALFGQRCAFCHGEDGKGDGPAGAALQPPPTNFRAANFWKTATSQSIKSTITNGKPNTAMVPFKGSFNEEQLDDLEAFLETLRPATQ